MRTKSITAIALIVATFAIVPSLGGCGAAATVPDELEITLPDGTTTNATLGSGVISLANSEWVVTRNFATGQGVPFVRFVFNENGGITEFRDNSIAPEIFGDTLFFDGARHETNQPGISYEAGVFGAGTEDGTGVTFVVRVAAFAVGLQVASAEASVVATIVDDSTMSGTLSFSIEITDLVTSFIDLGNFVDNDEFEFTATRLEATDAN